MPKRTKKIRMTAKARRFLKTSALISNEDLRFNRKARFTNALMVFILNCKHWRVWCNKHLRGAGFFDMVNVKKIEAKAAAIVLNRHFKAFGFSPNKFMFNHEGELVQE